MSHHGSADATTDHRNELLHVFHLSADDVAANRSGALAPGQRRRLVRSSVLNLVGVAGIGLGLAAVLWLVADKPLAPVQWILAAALVAVAAIVGLVQTARLRADARAGAVECVTGVVRVRRAGRSGWFLHVDDRTFRLPVHFWHLPVEASYRVYVTPTAHRVVAMEPDGWD